MASAPHSAAKLSTITEPGFYRADRGLYLQVKPNGARSWVLRFQLDGKPRQMGLGPLRLVGLTEARKRAIDAQRQLMDGIDPIAHRHSGRKPSKKVPTFAEAAKLYIESNEAAWRNEQHKYQWRQTLETYANPVIGKLGVDAVTVDHVVRLLRPIWTLKPETAGRVRGRVERVLDWAKAHGHRDGENPARWKGALSHILPALSKVQTITHHAAVPYAKVPALYAALGGREGLASAALQLLILTAARSGEMRGARWDEFDLDAAIWVVPADRMKMGKQHRVPLSTAAALLLRGLKPGVAGELVFPSAKGDKPLSDMGLLKAVRKVVPDATVHGLRSSFRDWAAESGYARELPESALAHLVGNEVERAYLRTDLLDQRRPMMEAWSEHCAGGK